jgi:hypothetical protein
MGGRGNGLETLVVFRHDAQLQRRHCSRYFWHKVLAISRTTKYTVRGAPSSPPPPHPTRPRPRHPLYPYQLVAAPLELHFGPGVEGAQHGVRVPRVPTAVRPLVLRSGCRILQSAAHAFGTCSLKPPHFQCLTLRQTKANCLAAVVNVLYPTRHVQPHVHAYVPTRVRYQLPARLCTPRRVFY